MYHLSYAKEEVGDELDSSFLIVGSIDIFDPNQSRESKSR